MRELHGGRSIGIPLLAVLVVLVGLMGQSRPVRYRHRQTFTAWHIPRLWERRRHSDKHGRSHGHPRPGRSRRSSWQTTSRHRNGTAWEPSKFVAAAADGIELPLHRHRHRHRHGLLRFGLLLLLLLLLVCGDSLQLRWASMRCASKQFQLFRPESARDVGSQQVDII